MARRAGAGARVWRACGAILSCLRNTLSQIRRAENPLADMQRNGAPLRTRALTIAHVHARYIHLLLNPLAPLCCEYSYNCVPAVHDPPMRQTRLSRAALPRACEPSF